MVVKKCLKDYVEDGRYTIVVAPSMKSLMIKIKELYPTAVVTTCDADGIGGKKLLVDKWAADGLGLEDITKVQNPRCCIRKLHKAIC